MKNLINIFALSILLITTLTACGNDKKEQKSEPNNSDKGSAVISVDSKTFTLPIQNCIEPHTKTSDGESYTTYMITASDAEANIKLMVNAMKDAEEAESYYRLDIDGGVLAGGTSYQESMPFEIFNGKSLSFKGKTKAKKMKNKDKSEKIVEITIVCK